MINTKAILKVAQKHDSKCDVVEKLNVQYKGYDVYDSFIKEAKYEIRAIGMPSFVLVKGDEIRLTTEEEALEICAIIPEDDSEEENDED